MYAKPMDTRGLYMHITYYFLHPTINPRPVHREVAARIDIANKVLYLPVSTRCLTLLKFDRLKEAPSHPQQQPDTPWQHILRNTATSELICMIRSITFPHDHDLVLYPLEHQIVISAQIAF